MAVNIWTNFENPLLISLSGYYPQLCILTYPQIVIEAVTDELTRPPFSPSNEGIFL